MDANMINIVCREAEFGTVAKIIGEREGERGTYPNRRSECTIYKVPRNIRRAAVNAYEPEVVAIGPYHRNHAVGREGSSTTEFKWKCLRFLLFRCVHYNRQHAPLEFLDGCLDKLRSLRGFEGGEGFQNGEQNVYVELLRKCLCDIKNLNKEVRSCYFDEDREISSLSDDNLALTMLLDGCFILYFLIGLRRSPGDEEPVMQDEKPTFGMRWTWNMIVFDLLKLENQVPFFVLEKLWSTLELSKVLGIDDLIREALQLFKDLRPCKSRNSQPPPCTEIHHILHLFYLSLLPSWKEKAQQPNIEGNDQVDEEDSLEWIPNATELKMSGIKFKRKRCPRSFFDVTFKNGVIEIPKIHIYDYTNSLLRNLIAFEQCYPGTGVQVTMYANFMDYIIDSPEDVKLLTLNDIIISGLGSDGAVADLFNNLCYQIHYTMDKNYLAKLFLDVRRYHNSTWHTYLAGLRRDYFNNPWAIISLFAALLLLVLTICQTYFAAHDSIKRS